MISTPVLLVIFNRPEATRKVFHAISLQAPTKFYIAADGPRPGHADDAGLCRECREIVSHINWDCEIKLLFHEKNVGCGEGMSSAITWFFEHVDEGIILEDDCLPNSSFFGYCTSLLEQHRVNPQIMMICGTSYQPYKLTDSSYYFSKYAHVWGWATWKRAWKSYRYQLTESDLTISQVLHSTFSDRREYSFWYHNMQMIKNGFNTWDYQWMYCIWKHNGLCAIPWQNLISNIGFGPDASHTRDILSNQAGMKQYDLDNIDHPQIIAIHQKADKLEKDFVIGSAYHYYLQKLRSYTGRAIKIVVNGW